MAQDAAVAAVFEPVQAPTTFEETVERLGTAIRLGLLQPASRLPPERDLAERPQISPSTLRPGARRGGAPADLALAPAPGAHDACRERPPGLAARPRRRHVRGRAAAA